MYRPATEEEKHRFEEAVSRVVFEPFSADGGIGTLSEKTLHAVLKSFYEPDGTYREIPVGRFVADIKKDDRILEIQTRSLGVLRNKLTAFLSAGYRVTVIHPVPAIRSVSWIEADGTVGNKRIVTRKGDIGSAFGELYKLRPLLGEENLCLRIVLLDVSDYRLRNGKGKDGKRGSTRYDRIPNGLVGQYSFEEPDHWIDLIPDSLPDPFTARELGKALRVPTRRVSNAVGVLTAVGAMEKVGQRERAYLYRKCPKKETASSFSTKNRETR